MWQPPASDAAPATPAWQPPPVDKPQAKAVPWTPPHTDKPVAAAQNVSRETKPASSPLMQGAEKFAQGVGESFMDIPREMEKQTGEALGEIGRDFTTPVQGKPKKTVGSLVSQDATGKPLYEKPGVFDYLGRVGKTALDVANYASGGAALSGAATSIVGRPVERATGIPRRTTGDIVAMATPFAGEIKGALMGPDVRDGMQAVQKVFSPTTVSASARDTERTIRRATGEGSLQAEKAAASLVEHNRVVGNLPVPQQRALVAYIENRGKGATIADPKLKAAADAIADVYDRYKQHIIRVLPADQVPKFIQDYYVHMWKEKPSIVTERLNAFRQGSGRSFKQRTIPTIEDGIRAGLTPKTENPIEATMAYAQNMSRFVATNDILNELKLQGYTKFAKPGEQPAGWVPLDGINTERMGKQIVEPGKPTVAIPGKKLYAPADVARVYNNFISKGLEGGDIGPFYRGARALANGLTMLKLGLSPFHLDTMANEAVTSGFARAFKAASRGDVGTAAKAAGGALAAPVTTAMRGLKMQRELLDKAMPDALSAKVNQAFVRSGGQLRMDPFYRTRASGSFFNAFEKGTFKREVMNTFDKIYRGTPWEKAKGMVDLAANVIQSTAAPLFEKYIPMVKRGAFASQMEDFLKANPHAPQQAIDDYAIKLQDSIDNRFGELVQDNLFWHKQMKQIAQLVLLSPTWDLGTVREIGGGLKDALSAPGDIVKGKGISDRTAYVLGLATEVALKNAIYTYLKTGTAPHGKDFMAGRTGGVDQQSGQPERVITPGYEKDVFAFGYDFPNNVLKESENKLSPLLSTVAGLATNKDYRGLPIAPPSGVTPSAAMNKITAPVTGNNTLDYLIDQFMPISVGTLARGVKKGSNIGPVERTLLADRPAPGYIQATDQTEQRGKHYGALDWKRRVKADARAKAQQQ